MSARAQRLIRGWIVGLVATTVAAVSHSLAGGYRPGVLSFGVALVFAGVLGTLVIGARPSLPRLAIAVGASQLAFHLLFSLLGSGGATRPGLATSGPGMPDMSAMTPSPVPAPPAMSAGDHLADPGMWIAHAVAAVLTILFLRHAELAVWGMLARIGRVLVRRLADVAAPAPLGFPDASGGPLLAPRPLTARLLVHSASRRGPPLLAF